MTELAEEVRVQTSSPKTANFVYPLQDNITGKIAKIAGYYGTDKVEYTDKAQQDLALIHKLGLENIPVCVAKTQYSLSCSAKLLGRPEGFTVKVRRLLIASGAGFIVAVTGTILRMPGLPKEPAAGSIDIDPKGEVVGLF